MEINQDTISVILLSLQVSTTALLIGVLIGIPFGSFLGLTDFPGKRAIVTTIFTLMGLPPVLVGVIVYLLLSKYGPLGFLQWLFTPEAMIVAQVLLVTPIITGLSLSAVQAKEKTYLETLKSLGATPVQLVWAIIKESRKGILSGVATAYGRAISEVGAVMLVGGNIEGHTRVMTTAIILETRKGNYDAALLMGAVLLVISFVLNSFLMMGMLDSLRSKNTSREGGF